MASFQKRGKTWQYTISRYIDGVYKPIRKGGFRTKKEAEIEAREIENRNEWQKFYKVKISDVTRYHYDYTYK